MIPHIPEPVLHATKIADLRPTQLTVGMREVQVKRQAWRARKPDAFEQFLAAHMVPAVLGPHGRKYLIDHHHLAFALCKEGVDSVFISVVGDLSKLDDDTFWKMMEFHGWTHPFDAKGRRQPFKALPKSVEGLEDDPYRSLAGELRAIGGFAKDPTPFSEFVWADFFRDKIKVESLEKDFPAALEKALKLARSPAADYLPGWCAAKPEKRRKPAPGRGAIDNPPAS